MAWVTADNAESEINRLYFEMQPLILALESHPLINRADFQSCPKALYFVWDFVRRTESILRNISLPALRARDAKEQEAFSDCVGRNMMIGLMLTTPKGEGMLGDIAKAAGEEKVDFGEPVRKAVREMNKEG